MYNQYAFQLTLGQTKNARYWHARSGRITSSNFHRIASAKKASAIKRCINDITRSGPPAFTPKACQMGLNEEDNAKLAYVRYQQRQGKVVKVNDSGICISNDEPWLATTPDGFVDDGQGTQCLLEVKCLYDRAAIPRKIIDIAKQRGNQFYCQIVDSELKLRKSHPYYGQVLGQMAITGVHEVHFTIYAPRTGEIIIIPVRFCRLDWDALYTKLLDFKIKYFITNGDRIYCHE